MKTNSLISIGAAFAVALSIARAAAPSPAVAQVGVYDSRVIAYAHFWTEAAGKTRDEMIANAKAAKAAGDTARFAQLEPAIKQMQARSHLQVFSTAPAEEAMAALKDKLPAIQQELGVARFVSKWDETALKDVPEASRVDATDRLAREFLPTPNDRQRKVIESMKAQAPLPLEQAKKLLAEGKL